MRAMHCRRSLASGAKGLKLLSFQTVSSAQVVPEPENQKLAYLLEHSQPNIANPRQMVMFSYVFPSVTGLPGTPKNKGSLVNLPLLDLCWAIIDQRC
ncbi:hypothetical protein C8J56DRAFT_267801 [Mycena floridula]|nr:hypothetical protein C8J56DRAFT_267801 [Mycena floridula]